jgi:phospholipase/carboxylesterase
MPPQSLSLVHLTRAPEQDEPGAPPLLLLLHGVGSHEGDLIQLAPYLDSRFFVVSARAPITLASLRSEGSYAWFHVEFTPQGPVINPGEAESSRQALLRFIDELAEAYGLDPGRVYVMGFSQGAIMGFSLALTRPDKLAGLVAHSGRILPEIRPLIAPPEALRGLPVLVLHGTADGVLPVHHGRASRDLLSALPVRLTYKEYPIGHEISAESLGDAAAWLGERLDER